MDASLPMCGNEAGSQVTRLTTYDLTRDTIVTLRSKPVRSVCLVLVPAVAVALGLSTVVLVATARAQVDSGFDSLRATEVRIAQATRRDDRPWPFPSDAEQRISQISGVRSGGVIAPLGAHAVMSGDIGIDEDGKVPVVAADPGALRAAGAEIAPLPGHGTRWAGTGALLGRRLILDGNPPPNFILVDGRVIRVEGVLAETRRSAALLDAVVLPMVLAEEIGGSDPAKAEVLISVAPGAASQVGTQAPYALAPERPDSLHAAFALDPDDFRREVSGDVSALFLLIALVAYLAGAGLIMASTMGRVVQRTPEFGVRRAHGAQPKHIRRHVLAESTVLGLTGTILGTLLGISVSAAVARLQGWVPIIDPAVLLLAPVAGLATGLLSGLWPARRAGRIEPFDALRHF